MMMVLVERGEVEGERGREREKEEGRRGLVEVE
jgi:hypothetical protein